MVFVEFFQAFPECVVRGIREVGVVLAVVATVGIDDRLFQPRSLCLCLLQRQVLYGASFERLLGIGL